MTTLGQFSVTFEGQDPAVFDILVGSASSGYGDVLALIAAAAPLPPELGSPPVIAHHIAVIIAGKDHGHEECTLTACLDPLHPGPCKGWKHKLYQTTPEAWHALEAKRVEKANAKRVAKIEDLKSKGLPIPKKLLVPIVAKPNPHAGTTAQKVSGEAHAASQEASKAAGVVVKEPGKVTLGQAVKAAPAVPVEKGPKGKKPTLASHGIAFVISQEKVTDQYKLTKAEGITPEQWAGLSAEDKATIRGELAKIQEHGFGPQQTKATALLAKLSEPKAPEVPKPVSVAEAAKNVVPGGPSSLDQGKAVKAIAEAIHGGQTMSAADAAATMDKMKVGGKAVEEHPNFPLLVNALANAAQKKAYADKMPDVPPISTYHGQISEHIAQGKPGLPPSVQQLVDHKASLVKKEEPPKVEVPKVEASKVEHAPVSPPAPATAPAHVQHAVAVAKGTAPGAKLAKTQVEAYGKLTPGEYQGLPPLLKDKILLDLKTAKAKFLDPKKQQAAQDLMDKLGGVKKTELPKVEVPQQHGMPNANAGEPLHNTQAAAMAVEAAKLNPEDLPNHPMHLHKAAVAADHGLMEATKGTETKVLSHPAVSDAAKAYHQALQDQHYAQNVAKAKSEAFGKINDKLAHPGSVSPLQKVALEHYLATAVHGHPVATGPHELSDLQAKANQAHVNLLAKIKDVQKAALPSQKLAEAAPEHTPKHLDPASHVATLLGHDATNPKINISLAESLNIGNEGVKSANAHLESLGVKIGDPLTNDPQVGAKYKDLEQAYHQLYTTHEMQAKLQEHLDKYHGQALKTNKDAAGNTLSDADRAAIVAHRSQLKQQHLPTLQTTEHAQMDQVEQAKKALHAAVEQAKAKPAAGPLNKLSDEDRTLIHQGFAKAWGTHASAAVTHGMGSSHSKFNAVKSHPLYGSLNDDYKQLRALAGDVAVARAEEHMASLNVPTNLDTGALEKGPEHTAWQAAAAKADTLQAQFNALHKTAQAKLDKIRTDSGLKKRSLPALDAPAVKAAAAEHGFVQTSLYGKINHGKVQSAKVYMKAKVGPKLGVEHKSSGEKKAEALAAKVEKQAAQAAPVPAAKIENVKLGDTTATTSSIPAALKKQITSDFKGMPQGKYLADPAEHIFDNVVALAAAHGKGVPGGLSVDQVLKTIDETHAANLHVENTGMMHKKITDWLGTAAGKTYAQEHSTPDPKKVKQLTGELYMPPGVSLGPGEKVQKLAGPGAYDPSLPTSAFKPLTATEITQSQNDYMKKQGITWSAEQKQAIKHYTGSGYIAYNDYLRGKSVGNLNTKQAVLHIQSAMVPLQQHTLLKRGTGWEALPPEFRSPEGAKKLLGKTFQDDAFVSTTVGGESGEFSHKPLQLIIEAPAGSPAAWINNISHYKGIENEMLLAAGTKYKVLAVEQKPGHTLMRVRIVGDK